MSRQIDPHTIYATSELETILKGSVKIETLREHGLVGLPGAGYWGGNAVEAMDTLCKSLQRQRGLRASERRGDDASQKRSKENARRRRLARRGKKIQEVQDHGNRRKQTVHTASGEPEEIPSQREKLKGLFRA